MLRMFLPIVVIIIIIVMRWKKIWRAEDNETRVNDELQFFSHSEISPFTCWWDAQKTCDMINCRHLPCLHSLNHHHEVNYLVMKFLGHNFENMILNDLSLFFQNKRSVCSFRFDIQNFFQYYLSKYLKRFLGKAYKTNTLLNISKDAGQFWITCCVYSLGGINLPRHISSFNGV